MWEAALCGKLAGCLLLSEKKKSGCSYLHLYINEWPPFGDHQLKMLLGILYSLYSSARWRDINRRLKEENCNLSLILFSGSINISGVPNSPHQVVLLASLFQELYDARTESNRIKPNQEIESGWVRPPWRLITNLSTKLMGQAAPAAAATLVVSSSCITWRTCLAGQPTAFAARTFLDFLSLYLSGKKRSLTNGGGQGEAKPSAVFAALRRCAVDLVVWFVLRDPRPRIPHVLLLLLLEFPNRWYWR